VTNACNPKRGESVLQWLSSCSEGKGLAGTGAGVRTEEGGRGEAGKV